MMLLSEEQLKNLNKDALIIIVSSLQDQLNAVHSQLDNANAQLAENNRQIERIIGIIIGVFVRLNVETLNSGIIT